MSNILKPDDKLRDLCAQARHRAGIATVISESSTGIDLVKIGGVWFPPDKAAAKLERLLGLEGDQQ